MSGAASRARRLVPKALLALAALALAGVLLALFSEPAEAATFTVNRTGDASDRNINNSVCDVSPTRGNQCTLRAAIQEANDTPGPDVIRFNIGSTSSVKTISPASPLPIITEDVTIDGYTQRGARANTLAEGNNAVLKVQLNGTNAGDANGLMITASNSTIKGLVINRFEAHGVLIFKSLSGSVFNKVEGNFIGTNADGTADLGNGVAGVSVGGVSDNTIGGTDPGARNVISGNGDDGVRITESTATGNEVLGNFIGTTASGSGDLGNTGEGVFIENGSANTIGDTESGARNVISGNGDDGVEINKSGSSGATANNVEGNFIGTTASGSGDLGNTGDGVFIGNGSANTIGGTASGARNVISGNGDHGVRIVGTGATGNEVLGNFIGTTADGTGDLGNRNGVNISIASNNTIGGTTSASRNVISGNSFNGVAIQDSRATGNEVLGNFIGTTADGSAALGNGDNGVSVGGAPNNTIGGTASGAGNRIAHNDQDGVSIASATGNSIFSNSIFSNTGLGIDLGASGVTPNDTDDPDTGANNLQNFPVISQAFQSAPGPTSISGTLNSNPNQSFTIQCFVAAPDTSSSPPHGEGAGFLTQTTATTNDGGDASFSCTGPAGLRGLPVTATATNTATGDTSEFSQNFPVS